jgi:hypothetical protein
VAVQLACRGSMAVGMGGNNALRWPFGGTKEATLNREKKERIGARGKF